MASSSSSVVPSATSSGPAGATSSPPPQSDSSPTSRPLLFFVALGFGVVFTNLWIIVGVKYCFRYNRNRRGPLDENGNPIDLNDMPRPRRKREKKLMSMEEVNERFPLTKYKIWRSTREQSGLPNAGGITAPPSRAQSVRGHSNELKRVSSEGARQIDGKDTKRASDEHSTQRRDSGLDGTMERPSSVEAPARASHEKLPPQVQVTDHADTEAGNGTTLLQTETAATAEDDDDDPIQRAGVPAEYAQAPGDTCAICIDTLEDEDDVRGLTCGHAFHAGCLDPWLTSRRACCPLCKADFYVPKLSEQDGTNSNGDLPQPPEPAHRGRVNVGGANYLVNFHYRRGFPTLIREWPARPSLAPNAQPSATEPLSGNRQPTQTTIQRMRLRLPSLRVPFRRAPTTDAPATPGQLETGSR